jgi:hypothetical protein
MPISPPRRPMWIIIIGVTIAAAFVLFFSVNPSGPGGSVMDAIASRTPIPPTFFGMRWFYAATMAMTLAMSALASSALIENCRFLLSFPNRWEEPAKVTVINESLLLLAIIVGVTPDAIVLLSWGDPTAPAYSTLAALDRALDFASGGLFLIFMLRRIRSRPVALFQLQRDPIPIELQPTMEQLRPKFMMIGAILLIAVGVAFAK